MEIKSNMHIGIVGTGKSNGLDISEILKQIKEGEASVKLIEENHLGIDLSKYKNSIVQQPATDD